jgi:O-antigen ligase
MIARSSVSQQQAENSSVLHRLPLAAVGLWLFYMIVFGGVSTPNETNFVLQSLSSLGVIAISLWRLRRGFPTSLSFYAACLLLFCFLLVFVQLVPLPATIWTAFPGREFQVRMFSILGVEPPWQPISLSPAGTKAAVLAFLPATAGFLAALASTARDRIWFVMIIASCALLGLFVGFMQQIQGPESSFYFYGNESGVVSGTFGNRNFYAAQLYSTIPFVAALAVALQEKFRLPNWLVVMFSLVYVSLLIIGLAGTASRAGTLLSMIAVLLAAAFVYRPQNWAQNRGTKRSVTFAVLGVVLLLSQVGMAAILRFAKSDLVDMRGQIYEVSWTAAKQFFPYGSGLGSFVPVYQMFETPSIMIENYVNHVHNDWLELLLEGGIGAAVLMLAFVLIYAASMFQVFRLEFQSSARSVLRAGGIVVLLLLLHGIVDFGLRTPALITIFGLSCGFVTLGRQTVSVARSGARKSTGSSTSATQNSTIPGQRATPGTFRASRPTQSESSATSGSTADTKKQS